MLYVALIVNILILAPLTFVLVRANPGIDRVYGPDSDARRILTCLYATLGLASLYALYQATFGNMAVAATVAQTLLPLQIIYKLGTVVAVGLKSPVVLTNLAVCVIHAAALATL